MICWLLGHRWRADVTYGHMNVRRCLRCGRCEGRWPGISDWSRREHLE